MGLVVVPLLTWAGHPLPQAVALLLGAAAIQTGLGTYFARRHVHWSLAFRFAGIQWLFVPLGVLGMVLLVERDPHTVKQAIGASVLVLLTLRLALRPELRERAGAGWTFLAASSGGFLGGLVGMGGPPIVLYAMAHDWEKDRFRAFLWSQFLLVLPIVMLVLRWRIGSSVLPPFLWGLALAPFLWIGTRAGIAVSRRWSRRGLQVVAAGLLYAIGVTSVLAPLVGG